MLSELMSAPRLPHTLQVKRSSISDSLASSGQASPLIAMEWWVGKENLHVRRVVAKEASAGFRFKLPKFPSAAALLMTLARISVARLSGMTKMIAA